MSLMQIEKRGEKINWFRREDDLIGHEGSSSLLNTQREHKLISYSGDGFLALHF